MPDHVVVAVDASSAVTGGGLTYLREILPRLAADPRIRLGPVLARTHLPHVATAVAGHGTHRTGSRFGSLSTAWSRAVLRSGTDVVLTPTEIAWRRYPVPQVLALRNPVILDPEMTRLLPGPLQRRALLQRLAARRARNHAEEYLAVSEYARDRGRRALGLESSPVRVIYHGGPEAVVGAQDAHPVRRLLFVSSLYRYKGLDTLLQAMLGLPSEVTLDVAGDRPDRRYGDELDTLVARLGLGERVRFHGYLYALQLEPLYGRADLFVWPSWGETFGHPLLEAHARGLPIVAADACSNREIAGDAARYYAPGDLAGLAGILREATERGLEVGSLPRRYDWSLAAAETVSLLTDIAQSGRRTRR